MSPSHQGLDVPGLSSLPTLPRWLEDIYALKNPPPACTLCLLGLLWGYLGLCSRLLWVSRYVPVRLRGTQLIFSTLRGRRRNTAQFAPSAWGHHAVFVPTPCASTRSAPCHALSGSLDPVVGKVAGNALNLTALASLNVALCRDRLNIFNFMAHVCESCSMHL